MTDLSIADGAPAGATSGDKRQDDWSDEVDRWPWAGKYAASLALAAVATVVAFAVEHAVAASGLTLLYVIPVVIAASSLGWGPSLAAVVASVLAFDFFFTEPKFSLTIYSASDVWAAALLAVTATIVSAVAGYSRRRAMDARRAAEQAEVLQSLAHLVIEARPQGEVVRAAATALSAIFRAPAAIFAGRDGSLALVAIAQDAKIGEAEEAAARGAVEMRIPAHALTYPNDRSAFDFWPVSTPAGDSYALGVDFTDVRGGRPDAPDRFVDVVAACLAAARGER